MQKIMTVEAGDNPLHWDAVVASTYITPARVPFKLQNVQHMRADELTRIRKNVLSFWNALRTGYVLTPPVARQLAAHLVGLNTAIECGLLTFSRKEAALLAPDVHTLGAQRTAASKQLATLRHQLRLLYTLVEPLVGA